MINTDEFYALYGLYDKIVIRMEEKLLQARKRDLNKDYSEQQDVIDNLIHLRQCFHKMYHLNQTLTRGQSEVMLERQRLMNKITRLELENQHLKTTLEL